MLQRTPTRPPNKALHISSLYILCSSLWVILSNRLSTQKGSNRPLSEVGDMGLETAKGILFIVITGGLLFLLLKWLMTRQEQAYEELRKSQEEYRFLFKSNPHPMWVFDTETLRFLSVNKAAVASYGYSEAEFLEMTIVDIRPPDDIPRLRALIRKIATESNVSSLWRHRKKNGEILDVEVRSQPLHFRGRPARLILAVDLTEHLRDERLLRESREELEQRVKERTAQLEAANRELETFSYSVSHDLRAPLRAIDGFSRLVVEESRGQLPAPAQEYLAVVRESARQMGVLIDEMLAFSKLSRQPLNRVPIPMGALARQALDLLHFEQADRKLEIHLHDLPDCEGDPVLLRQVFVNLISNALKFTRNREAAEVTIGFHPPEGAYYVRDNGTGFDMAHSGKLFGVFQRLHTVQEYEGTGIGLANVQRIVQRHGGRVWADAAPGKGATFFFTVGSPAAPPALP